MEFLFDILALFSAILLFFLALMTGTIAERIHYRSIRRREEELRHILLFAIRVPPQHLKHCHSAMVVGNVVVGMDYFKRTLAWLKGIFGGRLGAYETLIDRGRREAILRLKKQADDMHARYVINVKFTTANVLSGSKQNKGVGCVEVVAYGTALIER